MDSIKKKALSSVKWTVGRNFLASFIAMFFSIIIARLLSPKDFGTVAVANAFVAFGSVITRMGLGAAIIQKKEIEKEEVSACFTSSIILGVAIFLIVWFNINRIEKYFGIQNLGTIIILLSLTFILQSIIITSTSLLERNLEYKYLSKVEFFTQTIIKSVTTLILAYLGYGVWSIVAGLILAQLMSTIILFFKNRQVMKFTFKKSAYLNIYKYSVKYSLVQFIDYIYANMNTLFIGKHYGTVITGLFDRSWMLARLPISNIIVGVNRVMFPLYSRMQGQITESSKIFFTNLLLMGTSCSIIAGGMAAISEEIITSVLGNQWLGAIEPFKYLCIFSCFEYLASIMFSPLDSNNKLKDRIVFKLIPLFLRLIVYYIIYLQHYSFVTFLIIISIIEFIYFLLYLSRAARILELRLFDLFIMNVLQISYFVGTFFILLFFKHLLTQLCLTPFFILGIAPIIMILVFLLNLRISKSFGYLDLDLRKIITLIKGNKTINTL